MSGVSSQKKIDEFVSKLNLNNPKEFKKKLYDATRHGELANLADNQEALASVVESRRRAIREKKYIQSQREADRKKILAGGNLSTEDRGEVKQLLDTLGKGPSAKPKPVTAKASTTSPAAKSRPWKPWEKMPSFLADRLSPGAKNKPYSAGNRLGLASNRDSNLSSSPISSSSPKINPPRLIK